MKKFRLMMLATVQTLLCTMSIVAQTSNNTYVFLEELPDATYYLPAPPDSSSLAFTDDLVQFQWGRPAQSTCN